MSEVHTARDVDGVDISHWQSGIDIEWKAAKDAGVKWVYHKATEGTTMHDNRYHQRRAEARNHRMPFGAYHFARPDGDDAVAEARAFIDFARPVPGDLRPCLDLEVMGSLSMADLRSWAVEFCVEVERLTGIAPVVYTPYDLGTAVAGLVMWRPRYNKDNTVRGVLADPLLPWDIWQFSNGYLGSPNGVAGFGHVDLNTHAVGFDWKKRMLIPHKAMDVKHAHLSMQFSDKPWQMRKDVDLLFSLGNHLISGTEAGGEQGNPLPDILKPKAIAAGYRFHRARGEWLAVDRRLINGGWETGFVPVLESTDGIGTHSDRGIAWASWENVVLGKMTLGVSHLLTRGRVPGDPNYKWNRKLLRAIGEWGREKGKGSAIVFYHADQNDNDRKHDTFMGQPFTSAWDELEKWQNTGHGPIDVIASFDWDGRVSWKSIRARNDKDLRFHTDHFLVEAVSRIKPKEQ